MQTFRCRGWRSLEAALWPGLLPNLYVLRRYCSSLSSSEVLTAPWLYLLHQPQSCYTFLLPAPPAAPCRVSFTVLPVSCSTSFTYLRPATLYSSLFYLLLPVVLPQFF